MRIRNIAVLAIGQGISLAGTAAVIILGGILGASLAPSPVWATLPIALAVVGTALASIPAALLMQRVGRRAGFTGAAAAASLASLLAAAAIAYGSFSLFCLATLVFGMTGAFVAQYRFAAAESAGPQAAARAISILLLGGIPGVFLGPELAGRTAGWLPAAPYTGSFVTLAILSAAGAILMLFYRNNTPPLQKVQGTGRPLRRIVSQPLYLGAVLSGAVAYGVMSFVMTATPVHMHTIDGFGLQQTSRVIQSHIVAMFLPSLFTGFLLERMGAMRVMLGGIAFMLASVLLGATGVDRLFVYWAALVLLGLGWNLLFVGATVLLTRSYRPEERFKAQAVNDFTIFGLQSLASLSAGAILFYTNWQVLNLLSLPFLALALGVSLFLRRQMAAVPSPA